MEELRPDAIGAPETSPPTASQRPRKTPTRGTQARKDYDAQKQREHRQREADEQDKTAELPNSPTECPRRDAEVILGKRFQGAEPSDHLISLAFDMGTIAAEKLKICANRYFWRHGAQATLQALEQAKYNAVATARVEGDPAVLKLILQKISVADGSVVAEEVTHVFDGDWEDFGDVETEPNEILKLGKSGNPLAYVPKNSTKVFVVAQRRGGTGSNQ